MIDKRPEWRKRLDKARILAWLARGKVTAGPGHPAAEWIAALEEWHLDGDKRRLIALVSGCVQPPPELMAVACEATADALRGDRTRLRNHMPADLRRTLEWRAARSWKLRQEMRREWRAPAMGYGLNQAVADRVNDEWKKGGIPWRVPFSDKHWATERTVAADAKKTARNLPQ